MTATAGRLSPSSAVLVVVDYQQKMMTAIHDREGVLARAERLVRGVALFDLPVLVTEQYPRGLGRTEPQLVAALGERYRPIEKATMSVMGEPAFAGALRVTGRAQVILCGVEAHVCVCQSAIALRHAGYEVHVAADCVSSRRCEDVAVALRRMEQAGCWMSTHEMAVFELLGTSGTPAFKEWIRMIR
jgi:nicotinamidase-related amidase